MRKITTIIAAIFLTISAGAQEPGEEKAVLVTGASTGIGLAIAQTLAENGFHVYAGARKDADLERLNAMDNISAVRLDVTVEKDIAAAVEFVRRQGRPLWGIVNNAGIYRYSPLVGGPESSFRLTMDVNVLGPYRINQAFVPLLSDTGGRTAVIGSISGYIPGPADGGYSASKFAMEGYTDSLAEELKDTSIHVAIVEPGAYKSSIRETVFDEAMSDAKSGDLEIDEKTKETLTSWVTSNETMKDPDEVAQAVLHLMTSDTPKRRYMVTPNARQAELTIRFAMARLLELNEDQPYTYSRDELIALLDELIGETKED